MDRNSMIGTLSLKMPFLHKKPVKNFFLFVFFQKKKAFPVIYTGYFFSLVLFIDFQKNSFTDTIP